MSESTIGSLFADLGRPVIFAHRGGSAYAPENTLAAFKRAVEHHADAVELDAKLCADNHVVVMHDDTVDRTTNGTGRVKSLSLAELQKLDAGSKHPPQFSPQSVPSLQQVFEEVGRKIFINVELTNYASPTDDLPERVAALVKYFNLEERVMFSSFNMIALIRARKALPKVPLGLLTFLGLADASVRLRLIRFSPLLALHPNHEDVSPDIMAMLHRQKSRVHAYTITTPERMRQLFELGVDGIFTPDALLAQRVLAGEYS
jgi:glycerophosphoryl diester phosphodiesterase